MLPCDEVRNLIEEHLAETLDEERRRAVTNHLRVCSDCHRALEEARLAGIVLRRAAALQAPPDLAAKIKSAARTHLFHRPRPIHERALGSPAFLATCASLLCGAIICLVAIWRVGNVPLAGEGAPSQVAQAPAAEAVPLAVVRSDAARVVAVPVSNRLLTSVAPASVRLQEVRYTGRPLEQAVDLPAAPKPSVGSQLMTVAPREASADRMPAVQLVLHDRVDEIPDLRPAPALQRTSLPESLSQGPPPTSLMEPLHRPSPVNDLPPADARPTGADLTGPLPTYRTDYSKGD